MERGTLVVPINSAVGGWGPEIVEESNVPSI
jgi:hypothetical protein